MFFKVNDEVGISVEALYEKFGKHLEYCSIRIENNEHDDPYYYDIISNYDMGYMCHCDGENAVIVAINDDYIEFYNEESPSEEYRFKLSREECKVGIFGDKQV